MTVRCFSLLVPAALMWVGAATAQAPEAIEHYRSGYELLRNRNFRNAAIELEQAVAIDSTYGPAHFALGMAYKVLNEYPKAIQAYERAAALGMPPEQISDELGQLYYKSGITLYGQRKYQEAIGSFTRALEHLPGDAKAVYAMGLCYNGLRDSARARQEFERAVRLDPTYPKPYKSLGDIQRRAREYAAAAASYRRAIAADSTYMEAFGGLAQALIDAEDLEGTVALMRRATSIDDRYADGFLFLGTALNRLSRHSEAVEPLRRAAELAPRNAEAHYRLGEASYGKGDYRAAIEAGMRAVRQQRNFHAAEVLLGDAHAKLGQRDEARTYFTQAMQDSRFRDYCKHQIDELDRPAAGQ